MIRRKSIRTAALFGGFFAAIALSLYPILVYPYINIDVYQAEQKKARAGINQEDIQPGGMKVWSDPFGRK